MRDRPREPEQESRQRARLRQHRLLATGLLLVMAVVFVVTRLMPDPPFWVLLIRAGSEAAMIGGLADWFAVTALFRHPLGIPIPHTALVPRNKDRIGRGLASFVERNFLAPDLVVDKLRTLDVAGRLAGWLANPANARATARRLTLTIPILVESLQDREMRAFVQGALQRQLQKLDLAPMLGKVLHVLVESGHDRRLFDEALAMARTWLAENEDEIYAMVGARSRWWLPKTVDRRIARALIGGIADLLGELAEPDHEVRHRFAQSVHDLIVRLETSPELRDRVQEIKSQILANTAFNDYLSALWDEIRRLVLEDARSPSSRIRHALAEAVEALGKALRTDPAMQNRLNRRAEAFVTTFVVPWRAEIGGFIAEVVHRWDGQTVAERIELEVGRDLQYVRINGTVVGALVGCLLFLASAWLFP